MNKLQTKGLIMTAIIFLSTSIANGWPSTTLAWEVLGLTLIGTLAGYIAQSVFLPSTSVQGDLNWKDALKGLLISASNVLSSIGAAAALSTQIVWTDILKSIVVIFIGYIAKQVVTPQASLTPPTK